MQSRRRSVEGAEAQPRGRCLRDSAAGRPARSAMRMRNAAVERERVKEARQGESAAFVSAFFSFALGNGRSPEQQRRRRRTGEGQACTPWPPRLAARSGRGREAAREAPVGWGEEKRVCMPCNRRSFFRLTDDGAAVFATHTVLLLSLYQRPLCSAANDISCRPLP